MHQKEKSKEEPLSKKEEFMSWVKILFVSLIIGFIITLFVKPSLVSGLSMYPTLNDGDYLMLNRMAYKIGEPEYKDVVVFESHLPGERILVKRVIGVEGDTVKIENGEVFVNGKLLEESYVNGQLTDGEMEVVVPKDSLFVMGDNRSNSLDSRYEEVGFVHEDEIIGKAMIRLLPIQNLTITFE